MIVYLICLNSVIMMEIIRRNEGMYEYGMGVLFMIPLNLIYTFLCLSTIVLYICSAIFNKAYMILIGTLIFFVLTVCQHLLASYFGTYTGYEIWAYLLSLCGMVSYILSLALKQGRPVE